MQFKVKLLSFNEPASDSSRISREVVEQYLASEDYKKSIASKKMKLKKQLAILSLN